MSFVDYDNLCRTIGNEWLDRDDIVDAVKDALWLSECSMQRTIRFREVQDRIATGTTVDTQETITLPDDYGEGGLLRWTSDDTLPTLEVASIDIVNQIQVSPDRALSTKQFRVGFVWGNKLYIGPIPGEVDWQLFYKSGVRHLGPDQQTNRILRDYPDLLFYGALLHLAPFLGGDERVQTWLPFYTDALNETNMAEWRGRTGHGALRMRPDVAVF